MSNNKYIIDKDSLTGIADAVRDSLGIGDATTDETTGEIIYPENKGYYNKQKIACSFLTPQRSGISYNQYFQHCFVYQSDVNNNISWDDLIVDLCGEVPKKIKIVKKTYSSHQIYLQTSNSKITLFEYGAWSGSEKIIPYQSFNNAENVYIAISTPIYSSSGTSWETPQLEISFLNKDNQIYSIKNESTNISMYVGGITHSLSFLQKNTPEKIPFTINDIQDKITNYLYGGNFGTIGPIPTAGKGVAGNVYSVSISSIFTSIQDFRNRFLQANVNQGTSNGFFYLISKKNGRPASMKELGIPLPSNIESGSGSWNMADVRLAYENNLTFPICYIQQNGYPSLNNRRWLYVSTDLNFIVSCSGSTVGYTLSNSGAMYIAYLEQ